MCIASLFGFFWGSACYYANYLSLKMIGNTECSQEVCVKTIDATVLASPLRGKCYQ